MSNWISVEDRLPEENCMVVGAEIYDNEPTLDAAVFRYFCGSFHLYDGALTAESCCCSALIFSCINITHWVPLPNHLNNHHTKAINSNA